MQNKKLEDEVKTLQAKALSQSDVQKILEALQNVAVPNANADQTQQQAASSSWGLRTQGSNDVTLSSSWANGGFTPSSRPSTPSSPRPPIVRRSSPSLLAQHNPRKDMPVGGSKAGGGGNKASSWRGGPTVAASA